MIACIENYPGETGAIRLEKIFQNYHVLFPKKDGHWLKTEVFENNYYTFKCKQFTSSGNDDLILYISDTGKSFLNEAAFYFSYYFTDYFASEP